MQKQAFNKFTAIEYILLIALSSTIFFTITSCLGFLPLAVFEKLTGYTWVTALGLSLGSYATSIVARAPQGIVHIKMDPHCATCKTFLQTKDLFPIFSFLINNGICSYCGCNIPRMLFFTEFTITCCYIVCYYFQGFSESFLLNSTFCVIHTILIATWINGRYISKTSLVTSLAVTGAYIRFIV